MSSEKLINDTARVYEIGYIIASSVPTEKVAEEKGRITALLEKAKANILGGEEPELRPLAYVIKKKVGPINEKYSEGFFGWTKFEANPEEMEALKKGLDAIETLVRYLLITTTKENTYIGKKIPAPVLNIPVLGDDKVVKEEVKEVVEGADSVVK